jgi:pimeloyl-ACP methyl ester carboxylesterase
METLPKSIVFITGAFLSNHCWHQWTLFFESKGYTCLAPAWPFKDAFPEELRNRHPDTTMASIRLTALMEYFTSIVNNLPEKPILIGHSLGGLIVQLLLQRELGAAGVAIHSFPPPGVRTFKFSFVKAVWKAMALLTASRKTYLVPFIKWKHAFANGMGCEEQKELYYQYAVPESKLIIRDAFKCIAHINFSNLRMPLLFTSGGHDRIIPPELNYINYKKYVKSHSVTGYKDFRHHGHLVFDLPECLAEAEFILDWLQQIHLKN